MSVAELAAFVSARVDRWAWRNRHTRQTPVLLGQGQDFDLTVTASRKERRPPPTLQARDYPKWLSAAWKTRDTWRAEQVYGLNPRVYAELEHELLESETQWRQGGDPAAIQRRVQNQLQRFQQEQTAAQQATPQPAPRSLAEVAPGSSKTFGKTTAALDELLSQFSAQTASLPADKAAAVKNKLIAAFEEKTKDAPASELAAAVFHAALEQTMPTPDTLRLLDSLLRRRQAQPQYAETMFLRWLVELADKTPAAAWPTDLVRQALSLTDKSGRASQQRIPLPWTRGLLDKAGQSLHDGVTLLGAAGFAPAGLANQRLEDARQAYDTALAYGTTLEQAVRLCDRGFAMLPGYAVCLDAVPRAEQRWLDATETFRQLADAPAPPGKVTLSEDELQTVVEGIHCKLTLASESLEDLQRPFRDFHLRRLVGECERDDAGPEAYLQVRGLLCSALLTAENRQALWNAAQGYALRHESATLKRDWRDFQTAALTLPLENYAPERFENLRLQRERVWIRRSLAALRLGGIGNAAVKPLQDEIDKPLEQAGGKDNLKHVTRESAELLSALRRQWGADLQAKLAATTDLLALDRLAQDCSAVGNFGPTRRPREESLATAGLAACGSALALAGRRMSLQVS